MEVHAQDARHLTPEGWRPAVYLAPTDDGWHRVRLDDGSGSRVVVPDRRIRPARVFSPGIRLIYVGESVLRRGDTVVLRAGTIVTIAELGSGSRAGTWVDSLGERHEISAQGATDWVWEFGPYEVGDVVVDATTFTGVVRAAGLRTFSVLWSNGTGNTYAQDYQGIRRFTVGTWGDREAELREIAERRAHLVAWRQRLDGFRGSRI